MMAPFCPDLFDDDDAAECRLEELQCLLLWPLDDPEDDDLDDDDEEEEDFNNFSVWYFLQWLLFFIWSSAGVAADDNVDVDGGDAADSCIWIANCVVEEISMDFCVGEVEAFEYDVWFSWDTFARFAGNGECDAEVTDEGVGGGVSGGGNRGVGINTWGGGCDVWWGKDAESTGTGKTGTIFSGGGVGRPISLSICGTILSRWGGAIFSGGGGGSPLSLSDCTIFSRRGIFGTTLWGWGTWITFSDWDFPGITFSDRDLLGITLSCLRSFGTTFWHMECFVSWGTEVCE